MTSRTMTVVGALALVAGWLRGGTAGLPPAGDRQSSAPRVQTREVQVPVPSGGFTEQLRLRLKRQPTGPKPTRNPFVFGSRGAREESGRRTPAVEDPPVESSLPSGPMFTLSGIASSDVEGRTVRTAIINDGRGLLFVTVGDTLPGGFVVVSVDESMATLRDASGGERTISLK